MPERFTVAATGPGNKSQGPIIGFPGPLFAKFAIQKVLCMLNDYESKPAMRLGPSGAEQPDRDTGA